MDVTVGEVESAFIAERIRTGQNADAAEVIAEALTLLAVRDREREELRATLQVGLDDIEAGRVVAWYPGMLQDIVEEERVRRNRPDSLQSEDDPNRPEIDLERLMSEAEDDIASGNIREWTAERSDAVWRRAQERHRAGEQPASHVIP